MKKFLSIILSLAMVFTLSVTAFAAERPVIVPSRTVKVTLNEYELAKKLAAESSSTLATKGFTSREIDNIVNYQEVYRKHIQKLNTLNETTLANNGYSQKQINMIRNFTGSDIEMARLGAELTISSKPHSFHYTEGDLTTGRLTYRWSWNGIPCFKMEDMVAVSWNDWNVVRDTSFVNYYGVNTADFYKSESATFTTDGNGVHGAGHNFDVSIEGNYYYAQSGGGGFEIESDTFAKKNFFYYIEYGHSQVVASTNFSVGIGGGDASIDFSFGVVNADDDKGQYKF